MVLCTVEVVALAYAGAQVVVCLDPVVADAFKSIRAAATCRHMQGGLTAQVGKGQNTPKPSQMRLVVLPMSYFGSFWAGSSSRLRAWDSYG